MVMKLMWIVEVNHALHVTMDWLVNHLMTVAANYAKITNAWLLRVVMER